MTSVLSLFCGCGGLDLGFAKNGFEIVEAYDNWGPAIENHNKNKNLIGGKAYLRNLSLESNEIDLNTLPKTDVVLGGPPCQGFSFAGKQRIDDPRNGLYLDFKKIVDYIKPKIFLMENVSGLEKMALSDVQKSFKDIDYKISIDKARAIDLGIPQRRERIIIVGSRIGEDYFVTPDLVIGSLFGSIEPKSIFDVISDLPQPSETKKSINAKNHLDDHFYYAFSKLEEKFINHIPNGGYYGDAPRDKLPPRLQKIYDNPIKYKSPRLFPKADPNKPSQTVPASSSPSIGGVIAPDLIYMNNEIIGVNPEEYTTDNVYTSPNPSRRFTPREIARIQTFPDEYIFTGKISVKTKLIGNAVPVELASSYARSIRDQFF
ncbi:MAG: hypothetical protein CMK53_09980 [Proteobacteria bacterium]|nr:hypothetical protein [Pseudomonadota bacterium]